MQGFKNRLGFALPLVVVFLVVLSFALAAGLAATAAEGTTMTAQKGQNRAYSVAEQGLQRFLIKRDSLCALSGNSCLTDPSAVTSGQDSVTFAVRGGYAVIVARLMRPQQGTKDTIPALFYIRARGVDSTAKLRGGDTTNSVRSVGLMVQWTTTTINVTGAWTSLSGLSKQGAAGQIDGNDQCGRKPAVAGVMVPKGDYSNPGGGFTPTGNPPLDTTKSLSQIEQMVTIDWNGIVNNNALAPYDFEVPPGNFPDASYFADTTKWPIIRVHTNGFPLPNAGRGIIIADSDFVIQGANMWSGVVLVGGQLTSDGNNTTSGTTVSGLNYLLPGATPPAQGYVGDDATANGTKTYVYNSCNISKATQRLKHYIALPNTWVDDIPIW